MDYCPDGRLSGWTIVLFPHFLGKYNEPVNASDYPSESPVISNVAKSDSFEVSELLKSNKSDETALVTALDYLDCQVVTHSDDDSPQDGLIAIENENSPQEG